MLLATVFPMFLNPSEIPFAFGLMEKHLTQFNYPSCISDSREDLVPCLGVVHSKHLGQKLMMVVIVSICTVVCVG